MNSEAFLATVLAPAHPDEQQQVLLRLLDQPYAEAQALPTETARRNAHLKHILRTKELIETLVGPELLARAAALQGGGAPGDAPAAEPLDMDAMMQRFRLAHAGGAYFFSALEKVRQQYRHRVARREYCDDLCGRYPWRDAEHEALHVRPICTHSEPSALGHRYPWALVEPYVCTSTGEAERAALYQSRLCVRELTAADLQSPDEQTLIGQRGVFAHAAIPAGSCVGVYGGQVLDRADLFILQDDRYLISASSTPGEKGINGENMMAIMNTHYLLEAQGKVTGHPPTGYNVEPAAFAAETVHGEPLIVHAFFATRGIAAGEELRWNYNSGRLSSAAEE
jgi:hypothetical protein